MATTQRADVSVDMGEDYQYLERRPKSRHRQLYLKGHNLTVGQLIWKMEANGVTAEEASREYDLPPEQVAEALLYHHRHRDLIEQDEEDERQLLAAAGIIVDASSPGR